MLWRHHACPEANALKSRSLLWQTIDALGSMASNHGLQIVAGIVLSRVYGPAGKGLINYAGIAVLGVIAIADGLAAAIARQCGNDRSNVAASYAAACRIVLTLSAVAVVPLVALGLLVPAQRALLYVGIAFPFALYAQTMSGFNLLSLRVGRTNVAALVINGGSAVAMLIAIIVAHPPIDVVMQIWTAGYLAGAVIIHHGLREVHDQKSRKSSLPRQLRFSLRASYAALIRFLASRIDVFIVAATLSATALGNYTLVLACGELLWQVGRALSWSAYARVATAPFARAAELTARIIRIVLAIEVAAAVSAFVVGPSVLAFVYGQAFSDAGLLLRILVPGMALYAADAILTYFLSVKVGWPDVIMRVEAITLAVCAVGSAATIARFGLVGPAIATTAAYLVSFIIKAVLFTRATGINVATLLIVNPSDLRLNETISDRAGPLTA